jgi:hypothetical protein
VNKFIKFLRWFFEIKDIKEDPIDPIDDTIVDLPQGVSGVQNGKEDLEEKARRAKIVEDGVRLGGKLIS